ncbi:TetR/AcrR family transcriptional regulator [Oerskovia turbata]
MSAGAVRRGRRPAGEDTRASIVAAAREEFAAKGYDAVSMRGVARVAGVDPGLIRHYFDGKGELFAASLIPAGIDPQALAGRFAAEGTDGLGERLARTVLAVWDGPDGQVQLRLVLSGMLSGDEHAQALPRYIQRAVLDQVVALLPPEVAARRVGLLASQVLGVLIARHVLRMEPLASMSADEVARSIAPTLQRYLDGVDEPLAQGSAEEHNSSHGE